MSNTANPYLTPVDQPEEASESWTPPPSVTNHKGEPLDPQIDLFFPPPREIGEVLTAYSTLKKNKHPKGGFARLFTILGLPIAFVIGVSGFVGTLGLPPADAGMWRLLSFCAALIWIPFAWYYTRFSYALSYVGSEGVARCRLRGRRGNVYKHELFLFRDATELRNSQTSHYTNGVYSGTNYTFTWSNAGQKRFGLNGRYSSAKGDPKSSSEYWLARSAEGAWSVFLHPRMVEALNHQGFVQFNLLKDNCVRVGPGFLEFQLKGEVSRLTPAEVRELNIHQGTFYVKTHDVRWFSRKGNFSFSLQQMANSRLFLWALENLVGYRFD